MSKTIELAKHLEKLHINNMYKSDFYWTWDKTDEELEAIFTVADALRDLRERNKSTRIFDSGFTVADALRDLRERNKSTRIFDSGLGISIFRDNSTRTRFSFASACNLLGLTVQDLDEKKSQIAHGETGRARSPTARPSGRPPTWCPSWPTSSASGTICSSARATSTRRPSWMP